MAGDWTRKPLAGSPLNIPARLMEQVIEQSRGNKFDLRGNVGSVRRNPAIIRIRNNTAAAVAKYGILGIGEPAITPTANEDEFKTGPVFEGATPAIASHRGRFAVLLEPLPSTAVGDAAIAGTVQVRLSGTSYAGQFAEMSDGLSTYLDASSGGSAQILWTDHSSSAERWAVVRLGAGAQGRFVRGKLDGDLTSGSSATLSVWRYNGSAEADTTENVTVYDWTGETILSGTEIDAIFDPASNRFYAVSPPRFLRGKLDGALSYQGSATMSIWYYNGSAEADSTTNVTVYDFYLSSGQTIASGTQIAAQYDVRSGRYYVVSSQCA